MNNRMPRIILNYRPKWTKTTLKAFEETSGRRRSRSVKAHLVTDDDGGDDDEDEVTRTVVVL
jgi:hypothetical protein